MNLYRKAGGQESADDGEYFLFGDFLETGEI